MHDFCDSVQRKRAVGKYICVCARSYCAADHFLLSECSCHQHSGLRSFAKACVPLQYRICIDCPLRYARGLRRFSSFLALVSLSFRRLAPHLSLPACQSDHEILIEFISGIYSGPTFSAQDHHRGVVLHYRLFGHTHAPQKILFIMGLATQGCAWSYQAEYFRQFKDYQVWSKRRLS